MHMFSPPVEQDSRMVDIMLVCICFLEETLPKRRGDSAQAEMPPKNISIEPQICAYMRMFLRGNSA
ncbi:hypothetical protein Taro_004457 [Colocasia esculenta]|uniref:Uncharacterized protein n=1 Tax=Colocasia esculenta TaxID=4460 RepID=A0A843TV02_COLES|nr:hypothetical protein [Colocasia esculenta]